jgi:hypothetical protein
VAALSSGCRRAILWTRLRALRLDAADAGRAADMLRESYLGVLDLSVEGGLAGGRFRIFGDFEHRAIYDASVLSFDDLQQRCPGAVIVDLKTNCRNTPRVLALAHGCDAVEWDKVLRPGDGLDPVVRFYRDAEHQCELLTDALQELHDEGFTGPQVTILSPGSWCWRMTH